MKSLGYVVPRTGISSICADVLIEKIYAFWVNTVTKTYGTDKDYNQEWSFDPIVAGEAAAPEIILAKWLERSHSLDPKISACLAEAIVVLEDMRGQVANLSDSVRRFVTLTRQIEMAADLPQLLETRRSVVRMTIGDSQTTFSFDGFPEASSAAETALAVFIYSRAHSENRAVTIEELLWIKLVEKRLDEGAHLIYTPVPYERPGFRTHQTSMAVTDPGFGHMLFTTVQPAFLDGVTVHLEHLERGISIPRSHVEPYRMVMPRMVGRVALRVAEMAPMSAYIGRPIFENSDFEASFLKTLHTFSAACNYFFSCGVTECKIALENMSAMQMIRFLRALHANTTPRKGQVIAAAFCVNVPILDDRQNEKIKIDEPYAVGQMAIEIAVAGFAQKVTWDGSSDRYPSECIITQLGFEKSLSLVHHAHEQGLLTYFSAGFRLKDVETSVFTGVDGVGIGGAQVLRYMDRTTGNHGPFQAENLTKVLYLRNKAETTSRGRGARLLAMLDQLSHEKRLLHSDLDIKRKRLFVALCDPDDNEIWVVLKDIYTSLAVQFPYVMEVHEALHSAGTPEHKGERPAVPEIHLALPGNMAPSLLLGAERPSIYA